MMQYTIAGKDLACAHCEGREFTARKAKVHDDVFTFINPNWLGGVLMAYCCDRCGRIEWYTEPDRLTTIAEEKSEPTECLSCSTVIPAGTATCPACGWSYADLG